MRSWEVPVFFGAALAAHLAAFLVTQEAGQDATPGGAGGDAPVTIAAASPELAALVEEWDAPPEMLEPAEPEVSSPTTESAPEPPRLAATPPPADAPQAPSPPVPVPPLPDAPLPSPALEPPPLVEPNPEPTAERPPNPTPEAEPETQARPEPEPEPTTALARSERPAPRPERLARAPSPQQAEPAPDRQPSEPRAEQRAAGPVGTAPQGGAGEASVATASPGERANRLQVWGAKIQRRLQQALVYPRQAQIRRIAGQAMVELTVGANGSIRSRRLVESSGSPILDAAALSTVDRARGIPPAPEGLSGDSFSFQLPVVFQGR